MQAVMQYDLFEEKTELSELRMEVKEIRESSQNVRKGIFKRHDDLRRGQSELLKLILEQQDEIQGLRDFIAGKKKEMSPKKDIIVKKKSTKVEDFFKEIT
jgi:hypothetical protein